MAGNTPNLADELTPKAQQGAVSATQRAQEPYQQQYPSPATAQLGPKVSGSSLASVGSPAPSNNTATSATASTSVIPNDFSKTLDTFLAQGQGLDRLEQLSIKFFNDFENMFNLNENELGSKSVQEQLEHLKYFLIEISSWTRTSGVGALSLVDLQNPADEKILATDTCEPDFPPLVNQKENKRVTEQQEQQQQRQQTDKPMSRKHVRGEDDVLMEEVQVKFKQGQRIRNGAQIVIDSLLQQQQQS